MPDITFSLQQFPLHPKLLTWGGRIRRPKWDYAQTFLLKVIACVCSYCDCLSQLYWPNSHQWPWNGKLVLSHNYSNWLCCKTHTLVLWNVAVACCAYEKECGLWGVKFQIFHWILQFSYLSLLLKRQCCRLKNQARFNTFIQNSIACTHSDLFGCIKSKKKILKM